MVLSIFVCSNFEQTNETNRSSSAVSLQMMRPLLHGVEQRRVPHPPPRQQRKQLQWLLTPRWLARLLLITFCDLACGQKESSSALADGCGDMVQKALCQSDGSNHVAAVVGYTSISCTAWCDQLAKVRLLAAPALCISVPRACLREIELI